jgi:hypothetical protein
MNFRRVIGGGPVLHVKIAAESASAISHSKINEPCFDHLFSIGTNQWPIREASSTGCFVRDYRRYKWSIDSVL